MSSAVEEVVLAYVPEYFRDAATRIVGLGYDIHHRNQEPHPRRRKSPREYLEAQNESYTQLRMTVYWTERRGPIVRYQGSVRDRCGYQLPKFDLGPDEFWAFAESGGQCPCRLPMYSEAGARKALDQLRRRGRQSGLRPQSCRAWPSVQHIRTSTGG